MKTSLLHAIRTWPIVRFNIWCFQAKFFVKWNKAHFMPYKNFTWRTNYISFILITIHSAPFLFSRIRVDSKFSEVLHLHKLVTFRNSFISLFECWMVRNWRPWRRERACSVFAGTMEGFWFLGIYACYTSSLRFLFGAINIVKGSGYGGVDTNFRRLFAILSLIVKNEVHNSIFNEKSHFLCVYCKFQNIFI